VASTIQFVNDGYTLDGLPTVGGHRLRLRVRVVCSPPPQDDVRLIGGAAVMVEVSRTGVIELGLAHRPLSWCSALSTPPPQSTSHWT
jgi:hypothetical protein